ncbi:hypothetical protein QL285_002187 [Trifolium repens]|nr:hypothetical protein QL285_002187 [Trifolium repens]
MRLVLSSTSSGFHGSSFLVCDAFRRSIFLFCDSGFLMESGGHCNTDDGVLVLLSASPFRGLFILVRSSFSISRGLYLLLLRPFHHYKTSSVGFSGRCVGDAVFFSAAVV